MTEHHGRNSSARVATEVRMVGRVLLLVPVLVVLGAIRPPDVSPAPASQNQERWIGTWATAAQPAHPESAEVFRNQTIRLIVHLSAGGSRVRIKLSNVFGNQPLPIGRVRVARRTTAANIDPASDRAVLFDGKPSTTIPARAAVASDPIELDVPALSDLAVSLFFDRPAAATTSHLLALQTSYVAAETGDVTAETTFPTTRTISSWPFLTGVDVVASPGAAAIVAFGSSTTDGDGSTEDTNRRWPDILAKRLHTPAGAGRALGVLNTGIIGNRLLHDSPRGAGNPFGPILGQAGVTRFERDVLGQSGARYVVIGLGGNDLTFPAFPFTPASEQVTVAAIVDGYRRLIARAHEAGLRVIGTTLTPFEGARFTGAGLDVVTYSPERDRQRQAVNEWIRTARAFDAVVDFDAVVRDPGRPTRLLPAFDSGDHLHVNDSGNQAQANAIPLSLFETR
jgi:lysophospholipase L1-like esterase